MESFKQEQTIEGESVETHGSKIRKAEVFVRGMFDKNMEAESVVRNIVEENRSSFGGPEERGY